MYLKGTGHRQSQPTSMETGAQRCTRRAQDTDSRSPPPWRQELKGVPEGHRTQTVAAYLHGDRTLRCTRRADSVAAHLHGDRSSKVLPEGHRTGQDSDSRSPPPWRQELKGLPEGHRTQTVAAHLHGDRSSKVYLKSIGHRQSQPTSACGWRHELKHSGCEDNDGCQTVQPHL